MRTLPVAAILFAAACTSAAEPKLTLKVEDKEPPKELSEAVRGVLEGKAMNVSGDKGKLICTIWVAKSLESKATADEAKAGLKYTQIEESTLVGAVKFPEEWRDYRKQKIKAGVYTLRLALQPMDGDHQGSALQRFLFAVAGGDRQVSGRNRRQGSAQAQLQISRPQAPRHDAPVPEQEAGGCARDRGQAEGPFRAELSHAGQCGR